MSGYDPKYAKQWKYERSHGQFRTVPVDTVVEHVLALREAGWSYRAIADAAGCAVQIPHRIARGEQDRVRKDLAAQLLSVDTEKLMARSNRAGFVLNVGARRRIEALLAIGWRHSDITTAMHEARPAVRSRSQLVLHQIGSWIAASTHDAVVGAYDALSMSPGPSRCTIGRSAKLGYLPPLAWDDDTIDLPEVPEADVLEPELDQVAIERAVAGDPPALLTKAEREEAVRRLRALGLSTKESAERLKMHPRSVQRDRAA